ncbi:2136_t:CDS:2 [Entrophospora sp. SA101]|nr:2136_t:CDS:2 [Entrophospora sp. SA101]
MASPPPLLFKKNLINVIISENLTLWILVKRNTSPLDLGDLAHWLDGSRGFCSIECSVHLEQLVCETKRDVFNKDGAQNIMQIHSAMEPKAQKRDGNNEDQNFNIWYCNNPCFCGFDSEDMMDAKQIVKYTDAS